MERMEERNRLHQHLEGGGGCKEGTWITLKEVGLGVLKQPPAALLLSLDFGSCTEATREALSPRL